MNSSEPDGVISPEEQAKQGTEAAYATAKLRADVARQQMRLAKDQVKRARKRFKEAKREAREAKKLVDVARRAWKKAKRRSRVEKKPAVEVTVASPPAVSEAPKKPAGAEAGGKRGSSVGQKQTRRRKGARSKRPAAGAGARQRR